MHRLTLCTVYYTEKRGGGRGVEDSGAADVEDSGAAGVSRLGAAGVEDSGAAGVMLTDVCPPGVVGVVGGCGGV
eukprot:1195260-Prorocentrum_minimum.AAC.2